MSERTKIIVIGTGGLAREFHAWFCDVVDIVGFSADKDDDDLAASLPGRRYDNSVTPDEAGTDQCVVAVSSPKQKRHLHQLLGKPVGNSRRWYMQRPLLPLAQYLAKGSSYPLARLSARMLRSEPFPI